MNVGVPAVAPSLLLSAIIGALHTCLYVLIRGRLRPHVLVVLPAAVVGAWMGWAVGLRLGDPFRLGDYPVLWASAFSWLAISVVVVAAALAGRVPRASAAGAGSEGDDRTDPGEG